MHLGVYKGAKIWSSTLMNEITRYENKYANTLTATFYEGFGLSSKEISVIPLESGKALMSIVNNADGHYVVQRVCASVRAAKLYAKKFLKGD